MKKIVNTEGENVVITIKKRPLYLVKNILFELFIIGSVYAPWYTNLMWCFGCEKEPALGTFFNTVYFFGAVILYSIFADRWWNIPCGVYMLLMVIGSVSGIIAPESEFFEGFDFFALSPTWGLLYFNLNYIVYLTAVLIFSLAALGIMTAKYFRKK